MSINSIFNFVVLLFAPLAVLHAAEAMPPIVGDGIHDDTDGIQAILDQRTSTVYLAPPPKCYLISRTLKLHSRQTLRLDRFTVIRLAPKSDCLMLANDEQNKGNM